MSDLSPITRDEIEKFKIYIEIAKYAITIVIALAAVCGALLKTVSLPSSSHDYAWLFVLGIVVNIAMFVVANSLVNRALAAVTKDTTAAERALTIKNINNTTYSLFVIIFGATMVYWSIAMITIVWCT